MGRGVVAVDELRRALRAAEAGEFRRGAQLRGARVVRVADPPAAAAWSPAAGERLLLVAGCGGGVGASTVAVGLAEAAGDARVVECCTVAASGLAAASTAELGSAGDGWVQGARGRVVLQRRGDRIDAPGRLAAPRVTDRHLTLLDCSWDLDVLLASPGWLGEVARSLPVVMLVARPTIASVRRLEASVGLIGVERVHAVLVGVDRRLPRAVEQALGGLTRVVRREGRLAVLPFEVELAVAGLAPDPLPARVASGCSSLLSNVEGTLR